MDKLFIVFTNFVWIYTWLSFTMGAKKEVASALVGDSVMKVFSSFELKGVDSNSVVFRAIFKGYSTQNEPEPKHIPYNDEIFGYGKSSRILFSGFLQNFALTICFSVVVGYMIYIVIALSFKTIDEEDDNKLMTAKKLMPTDHSFHDNIVPPKLRELFENNLTSSCDTTLEHPSLESFKPSEPLSNSEASNDSRQSDTPSESLLN